MCDMIGKHGKRIGEYGAEGKSCEKGGSNRGRCGRDDGGSCGGGKRRGGYIV